MPFSFATIWNTCWATSSIRAGAVASWSSADWTVWRLPDGTGAGAGASDPVEFAENGLPAEEAAAWLGAGRRLAGDGADRSCGLADDDDDVLLDPPPWAPSTTTTSTAAAAAAAAEPYSHPHSRRAPHPAGARGR